MRKKGIAGFTFIELMISMVILMAILGAIFETQTATADSFDYNRIVSEVDQKLARLASRIDFEVRKAGSGTIEVTDGGGPIAPVDGDTYDNLTFRQVIYDTNLQSTVEDPNPMTIALNGTDLQFTNVDNGTVIWDRDLSAFTVGWDSVLRVLTITVQVTRNFPDPNHPAVTRDKTIQIFLRNT